MMQTLKKISRNLLLSTWGLSSSAVICAEENSRVRESSAIAHSTQADTPITLEPPPKKTTVDDQEVTQLSSVVVTGSRSSQGRTVASSPTPIDVISSESILHANQRNLLEALNVTLPSFSVPSMPGYGVNATVKAGQLRGLNSSHTLVLVNGKRRHVTARLGAGGYTASAPADLGLIPTGSIERIEVLRDGAAAIYGSDAIAGVINIITKKADHGGSFTAKYGGYSEGDGQLEQYIASKGFNLGDRGHLFLSAQWDEQKPAFRDSPVPDNILFYFPVDSNGNQVLPAGNRSSGPTLPEGATADPREAAVDRDDVVFGASGGVPEASLGTLSADFAYQLSDDLQLYSYASYANRQSRSPQHFRFSTRDQVVRALWPDGFTPYSGIKEDDFSLSVGLKGSHLLGWDWDLSSGYGYDKIDTYIYDTNSPSFGLDSKTDFYTGQYKYTSWVNNLDLRKSLEDGLFGKLTDLSLGAEFRRETYTRKAGELQSWAYGPDVDPDKYASGEYGYVLDGPSAGTVISRSDAGTQADTGIRPEDTTDDARNSHALYSGISLYPTPKWVIDSALRYENYDDFGDIFTGRLSSRYDFSSRLALRGTISNGFQAPALAAQGYQATNVTASTTDRTLKVTSAAAQALGAEPLEAEKSSNFSLGIVIRASDTLNIAIDAYRIDVRNRISSLSTIRASNLSDATQRAAFEDFVQAADASFGANDGISYFINAGKTQTKGLDLTIEKIFDSAKFGRLQISLAGNWNKTELVERAATPAALTAFGFSSELTYNASSVANLENLSPRFKGIFALNWTYRAWDAGLVATRYGELKRSTNVNVEGISTPKVYDVGNLWLVDAHLSYQITDHLKFALHGTNIFDQEPGKVPDASSALWAFQSYSYLGNSPVNAAGSFYAASLSYQW
jgi:iron complex outermembrane receptor protein